MREGRLRVLLADDQPLCLWAVSSALAARGHDVFTTATREETCARLFHERFDVVILSCRIEGQDMADVAAALGRYGPAPRLVVLCGEEEHDCVAPLVASFVRLTRPFELAALLRAVDPPAEGISSPKDGTFP